MFTGCEINNYDCDLENINFEVENCQLFRKPFPGLLDAKLLAF